MAVRGELDFPVDFGDRLSWIETEDGTRAAASGQAPVDTATVSLLPLVMAALLAYWPWCSESGSGCQDNVEGTI